MSPRSRLRFRNKKWGPPCGHITRFSLSGRPMNPFDHWRVAKVNKGWAGSIEGDVN